MAWTSPKTWTVGEVVTASNMNTHLRDNMKEVWYEVAYTEFTGSVSVTATSEGAATTIVTASAYTFDGSEDAFIDFFAPVCDPPDGTHMRFVLYDGSSIGLLASYQQGSADERGPIRLARRLTPSAASHTYSVRSFVSSGTGTVDGGAGGSGAYVPGFIRITARAA